MNSSGPWTRAAAAAGLLVGGYARPTVFAQMSAKAAAHDALNLGQGYPDDDPPALVAEAAIDAIRRGRNQYPPGAGEAELREAVAEHQASWYGLRWDPATEVLVTTGATEALAATILALVEPGDEVITLEPFYDQYAALIALAGGVHRTVPITSRPAASAGADASSGASSGSGTGSDAGTSLGSDDGDLVLDVDRDALRAAFSERTRLVLVNTPHNPTGLMLWVEALQAIVEEAERHDALIVTDEVYEHLTFGPAHLPPATLPGAQDRTISISSAGKTFAVTGWKIGWITARAELITAITGVKQWLTYASGAPFQPAVASGLRMDPTVFHDLAADLRARRDLLTDGLRRIGFRVSVPEAGYFTVADAGPLGEPDARALAERLPEEAGVVAIPLSAFYRDGEAGDASSHLRLAFCKSRATIEQALERLESWAAPRR
ncbi:aminotransferase [Brachybacterium sp. HMSC06H03]|uniref:aminotransferase class I/II-fold pyridoxal phosphate-dependent enzyme n=1 Tax=Brachybacterium sp. HMSC06H03 TaxID=1581127 RepID=UPI0008A6065C|nr:aminotransferase class I/II-fold pyridoxal phosphate-dependent enzyme [Brachybacterium sp. HMSC06H03]OFT58088.1 aminotransferase [Brachybacterium sp. HMSC06H03]